MKLLMIFISALLLFSVAIADETISIQDSTNTVSITSTDEIVDSGYIEDNIAEPVFIITDTVVFIPSLDFSSVKLADALTAMSRAYKLPLYVDSSVTGLISFRLDNVLLNDALVFIIKEYGLSWAKIGDIIKIYKPVPPEPKLEPLEITYTNGLLSVDIKRADIERFVNQLIDLTNRNIILEGNVKGTLTGRLTNLDLESALKVILGSNGYTFRKIDEVIYVGLDESDNDQQSRSRSLDIGCDNNLVSVDVSNSPLSDVISVLTSECGANIFVQTKLEGNVTASFKDKTLEETITYLLLNTLYSFKETSGIIFIGNRESEDLYDTKLIKLRHYKADNLLELIPVSLTKQLAVSVAREHNGLVMTGPRTAIAVLESFIDKIDIPMAQVLFEVILVDYTTTDRAEFGITANNFGGDSGLPGQTYYPMVDISAVGKDLNDDIASLSRHLSVSNIGILSDDFFLRLQALQQEGKANVRSHPQIASLNGHSASITIGTTQYYLLESKTTYISNQSNDPIQTAQRFETIEADMSLEVIPYVNANRDLTVELKAEFNSPAGQFDPDIPPTINRRTLTSTIRLKDGETIILGGLVQENKTETIDKLPILGSLPIIGRLFQNHISLDSKSELMIYMTPHVYYGSEGSINIDSIAGGK